MIIITDGSSNDDVQTMRQAKEAKDAGKALKTTILDFYDVSRSTGICFVLHFNSSTRSYLMISREKQIHRHS